MSRSAQDLRTEVAVACQSEALGGHTKSDALGWAILPQTNQAHQLMLGLATLLTLRAGETLTLELKQDHPDHALGHFRVGVTTNTDALQAPLRFPPPAEIAVLLLVPADHRDEKQKEQLFAHFKSVAPETAEARKQLAGAPKAKDDFEAMMRLLGIEHTELSVKFQGLNVRLTGIAGNTIEGILA
jgi:hypothetical protein